MSSGSIPTFSEEAKRSKSFAESPSSSRFRHTDKYAFVDSSPDDHISDASSTKFYNNTHRNIWIQRENTANLNDSRWYYSGSRRSLVRRHDSASRFSTTSTTSNGSGRTLPIQRPPRSASASFVEEPFLGQSQVDGRNHGYNGESAPTFTEQTGAWASGHSLGSSLHSPSNSISTSTEEERKLEKTVTSGQQSFAAMKPQEDEIPNESKSITGAAGYSKKSSGRFQRRMYYLSLLCSGILLLLLLLLLIIYFGSESSQKRIDIDQNGGIYTLELKEFPGKFVVDIARNTFSRPTGILLGTEKLDEDIVEIFNATTILHQAEDRFRYAIVIDCGERPQQSMSIRFNLPYDVRSGYNAELFGLFVVNNVFANKEDSNEPYRQFEVLPRRWTPSDKIDATIPASAFMESHKQLGESRWKGVFVVAVTQGVKQNTTSEIDKGCFPVFCPFQDYLCSQPTSFSSLDSHDINGETSKMLNFGTVYDGNPGTFIIAAQATSDSIGLFFREPQTQLFSVLIIIDDDPYKRVMYSGLESIDTSIFSVYNEHEKFSVVTNMRLGRLPLNVDKPSLSIEVFPPETYLELRNFPKQRIEPCIVGGEIIQDKFVVEVSDPGILKDDVFDLFVDNRVDKQIPDEEYGTDNRRVFELKELKKSLIVIKIRASKKPGFPFPDNKATYRIQLKKLKFEEQPGQIGQSVNNKVRIGVLDLNVENEISFNIVAEGGGNAN